MNNLLLKSITHETDLCVIGGGIAGLLAAISAARNGAKVIIMQDRPVFGGNASSEIRMWIRGAHGRNLKETGILEELALENIYRNPSLNFNIWDSVLYEKVRYQKGIEILLNCSCLDAEMDGNRINTITGWQLTTQTYHIVKAKIFADCSGDSILVPLTGAECRMGREGSDEFGESIEPPEGDKKTMGMSCLIQLRDTGKPQKYIAPFWANKYNKGDLPYRLGGDPHWQKDNFWWIELGGEFDSITDTENMRDELLKINFGVWDYIKNSGEYKSENWELDWMGFLPGKRESRRYVGDLILNQNHVSEGGRFEDIIAYGGWSMDDHHPSGIRTTEKPTIFHPAPSPYGIPYRVLYSRNIENLMFAGRNISATHAALSSTRVMATCGVMGQALGTAAAIAVKNNLTPKQIFEFKIKELQQKLMEDDCYLPFINRDFSSLTKSGKITSTAGNTEVLSNGIERETNQAKNYWCGGKDVFIEITFDKPSQINGIRIIFDSDLNRDSWKDEYFGLNIIKDYPMRCSIPLHGYNVNLPETLVKAFSLEYIDEQGLRHMFYEENNNYQRLRKIEADIIAVKIILRFKETWGSNEIHLFSFEVY